MKKCPQCLRNYSDASFDYCLDDGAVLVHGPGTDEADTAILSDGPIIPPELKRPTADEVDTNSSISAKPRLAKIIAVIAGLALILAAVGIVVYRNNSSPANAAIKSIAVMPFINDSGDPEMEYLSDGMTDSLINSLAEIPSLTVKARSSVFRFKGKDVDLKAVATQLGVQSILSGRLVKHGDQLMVYLELFDPQTGNETWGTQYSRNISDLIPLQNDIARDVSQKLRTKLTGAEEQHLAKNYTTNVEAYQLYLKGRFHLFKLTPAGIQTGMGLFQQAIDLDPNYALAYVGLAAANRALVLSADMRPRDFFPRAKAAAQKAIELDDSLAEAHAVLGFTVFWYDWDYPAAEKEFKRALELNPNSADAHWGYGHLLSNTGRIDEALAEAKKARELDPLSLLISASEGLYLIDAGRTDEGIVSLQKTLEIEPNFWIAHMFIGMAYADKGMYEKAIAEAKRANELNPASSQPASFLAYYLAVSGKPSEATAILDHMSKPADGRYVPPTHVALIYNGLGNREQALAWLDRGLAERDPKMTFLKVAKNWNNLNDDPHFQEIVRNVGL
jgi:TolB-like protein/tetratricopeptide (TPR) repeat protein